MQTLIYILWLLLPLFFLGHALWIKLEQLGGRGKNEKPGDYFKQGLFVTGCSLFCFGFDKYVLQSLVPQYSPEAIPLWFYQFILLPIVLVLGAKCIGGTEEIRISKAPRPTHRKKR